jgi:hypothetical protein
VWGLLVLGTHRCNPTECEGKGQGAQTGRARPREVGKVPPRLRRPPRRIDQLGREAARLGQRRREVSEVAAGGASSRLLGLATESPSGMRDTMHPKVWKRGGKQQWG